MNLETALLKDKEDSLAGIKDQFLLPENTIYLDGNSLGPLLKETKEAISTAVAKEWGTQLIRGWNDHWLERQNAVASEIAKLINAKPHEVIVTDSVSVNFYKLVLGVVMSFTMKKKILTDDLNFPSDIYVLDEIAKAQKGKTELDIIIQNEGLDASESILISLNDQVGLLTLSHVTFKDAYRYDEKKINEQATKLGILNLWDLSHSVGSVEIDVKKQGMDMAVGCTYKFLNGGPGAPAFLYISEEIQERIKNPIAGWFSHSKPFDFDLKYEAHKQANKFLVGTSPMLSLTGIQKGVELFNQVGMKAIVNKREEMLQFFLNGYEKKLRELGFELKIPKQHGSHLALKHKEAYRINLSLINPKGAATVIITDHRPPNIIRIALTPLYVSFQDLYKTVERLVTIIRTKEYLEHSAIKAGVI